MFYKLSTLLILTLFCGNIYSSAPIVIFQNDSERDEFNIFCIGDYLIYTTTLIHNYVEPLESNPQIKTISRECALSSDYSRSQIKDQIIKGFESNSNTWESFGNINIVFAGINVDDYRDLFPPDTFEKIRRGQQQDPGRDSSNKHQKARQRNARKKKARKFKKRNQGAEPSAISETPEASYDENLIVLDDNVLAFPHILPEFPETLYKSVPVEIAEPSVPYYAHDYGFSPSVNEKIALIDFFLGLLWLNETMGLRNLAPALRSVNGGINPAVYDQNTENNDGLTIY
jgi:hypothetical protein